MRIPKKIKEFITQEAVQALDSVKPHTAKASIELLKDTGAVPENFCDYIKEIDKLDIRQTKSALQLMPVKDNALPDPDIIRDLRESSAGKDIEAFYFLPFCECIGNVIAADISREQKRKLFDLITCESCNINVSPDSYLMTILPFATDEELFEATHGYAFRRNTADYAKQFFKNNGTFDHRKKQEHSQAIERICKKAFGNKLTRVHLEISEKQAEQVAEIVNTAVEIKKPSRFTNIQPLKKHWGDDWSNTTISVEYYPCTMVTFASPFEEKHRFSVTRPPVARAFNNISIIGRDELVTRKNTGSRSYPTSLCDIAQQCKENDTVLKFWNLWFDDQAKRNPFAKDLKKLLNEWVSASYTRNSINVFPIQIMKALKYHNWNEYFRSMRGAKRLDVNFGKVPPSAARAAIRSLSVVDADSIPLLRDFLSKVKAKDIDRFDKERKSVSRRYGGMDWILYMYFCRNTSANPLDIFLTFDDYIEMLHQTKKKTTLRVYSEKRLTELHDDLSRKMQARMTSKIIIPKNTKFARLRELLPEEFEWITTKKRILDESVMQSNCVWSYAPRVSNDQCAIYSYVNPGTGMRHTIEFIKEGRQYLAVQIMSRFNQSAEIDVIKKMLSILGPGVMRRYLYRLHNNEPVTNIDWDDDPNPNEADDGLPFF